MIITNLKALPIVWHTEVFKPQQSEIDYIKSLPLKILDSKTETYKDGKVSLPSNSQTKGTVDSYIFEHTELERLKNLALHYADHYVKEILEIDINYYLTQSWSTMTPKNEKHHYHMHRNSLFGGVMYLQADRNKGGELILDCGRSMLEEGFNFEYNIKNYNIYNSTNWTHAVGTGDIVMFPGWLAHHTLPNLSDEDRIAVGFDFFVKGNFGSDSKWSKISI